MPKISLRKALQKKNLLAGRLSELRDLIVDKNSYKVVQGQNEGDVVDTKPLLEKYREISTQLVELKSSIQTANAGGSDPKVGAYYNLTLVDEVKSLISLLQSLPTRSGVFKEDSFRGATTETIWKSHITESDVRALVSECKDQVEQLIDGIDEFNASTLIEYSP